MDAHSGCRHALAEQPTAERPPGGPVRLGAAAAGSGHPSALGGTPAAGRLAAQHRILPDAVRPDAGAAGAAARFCCCRCCLGMMVPLPNLLLDRVTGQAQLLSTALAAHALHVFDSSATQQGNVVTQPAGTGSLVIGVTCSGLELAIASLMVSWFMAFVFAGPWWGKGILLAASLPLSALVNFLGANGGDRRSARDPPPR